MKTTTVETAERSRSPLGAYIRVLVDGPHGNMIHSTVPPGMVGRACRFRTVDEYWFVLSGEGEMWRRAADGRETITPLIHGVSVDVPLGTASSTGAAGTCHSCSPASRCRPGPATTRRCSWTGRGRRRSTWSRPTHPPDPAGSEPEGARLRRSA